jgi:hypothetical protein
MFPANSQIYGDPDRKDVLTKRFSERQADRRSGIGTEALAQLMDQRLVSRAPTLGRDTSLSCIENPDKIPDPRFVCGYPDPQAQSKVVPGLAISRRLYYV